MKIVKSKSYQVIDLSTEIIKWEWGGRGGSQFPRPLAMTNIIIFCINFDLFFPSPLGWMGERTQGREDFSYAPVTSLGVEHMSRLHMAEWLSWKLSNTGRSWAIPNHVVQPGVGFLFLPSHHKVSAIIVSVATSMYKRSCLENLGPLAVFSYKKWGAPTPNPTIFWLSRN